MFFGRPENWASGFVEGEDSGYTVGGFWVTGLVFEPVGTNQYAYPVADIAANGWLPSTGADLYPMLDEVTRDDSDYIYSPDSPTTQQFEVQIGTLSDPAVSTGHVISIGLIAAAETIDFDLDLVQGSTVLDSWTKTVAAGTADISERTLSGAVADSITDYSDLRVRGVAHG